MITKDKNGENVSHLKITEVVLVHWNIVNNDYQHNSRALYKFVPVNSFSQLLDILPNLSRKYSQKPLDHAKQSTTDALKTASKKAI